MIYKRIKHVSVPLGVSCEDLTPTNKEVFSVEGSTATLSYKYSKKATRNDRFFWYRQYPGKPPEFLISHFGTGEKISDPVPRITFNVNEDKTLMTLQISSAAVSDSAVYYSGDSITPQQPEVTKTEGRRRNT
uniref:Immunoglobulin V-set domain-containing protein n=1 Tax=Astatotilapia calliptera TaxID=8154 RepID=A0A3P8QML7_ASTCA